MEYFIATIVLLGILVIVISCLFLLFTLYSVIRSQRPPADESNRVNKLILIWFALTREDLFVGLLPFLKRDLRENFKNNYHGDSDGSS